MTQILLLPLMLYAGCGLVLSLTVHILSFFGNQFGGNALFMGLHVGIFPLWIPIVLIAQKMSGGARRKDFWKIALSGCPPWMRNMTYGFFIYAIVNFAIFIVLSMMHPQRGAYRGSAARLLRSLDGVLFGRSGDPDNGLSPRSLQSAAPVSARSRN
jgi:hypothetical protein